MKYGPLNMKHKNFREPKLSAATNFANQTCHIVRHLEQKPPSADAAQDAYCLTYI